MSESIWNLTTEDLSSLEISVASDEWMHLLLMLHAKKASVSWVISSTKSNQETPDFPIEEMYSGCIVVTIQHGKISGFDGHGCDWNTSATFSLEKSLGLLMADGVEFSQAMSQVGLEIIEVLATIPDQISIKPSTTSSERPLEIQGSLSSMLVHYLESNVDESELLRRYSLRPNLGIYWRTLPVDISRMGLPIAILRSLRNFQNANAVNTAVGDTSRVTQSMIHFYILHSLGFWRFADETLEEASIEIDEEVDEEVLAELEEMLNLINSQPAYVTFGLTAPNEACDQFIDAAFRNLSLKWHPDRFQTSSKVEREFSTNIFTQLNELYDLLNTEEVRAELKKRLDVERRGLQYVSTEDESKANVLQAQGKFFFRKRKYGEAKEVLDKAFELNPYNWRINTLLVRCLAELELKSIEEVAEILETNRDARGADRVELMYQSGIYYFQSGNTSKAYELFAKVAELDDSHIDAKRYLHRRKIQKKNKTASENEDETSSGFFGRLFGKKS